MSQYIDHNCISNLNFIIIIIIIYLLVLFFGFQIYSFQKVLQVFPVSRADESKVIIIRKLRTYIPCQSLSIHLNMLCTNHFVSLL